MKTNRVWRVWLGLALVLGGAAKPKPAGPGVVVYVRQENVLVAELGRAERTTTRIFASIGVPVAFRTGAAPNSTGEGTFTIVMQLDEKTPAQFHAGALAYALPFGASGTRIHVFCDRVSKAWPDGGTGAVLGHVMAHEIGHVLEGVSRHSEGGVMKARWENGDYRQMISGTMPFDPTDAELIHAGVEARGTQLARAVALPR